MAATAAKKPGRKGVVPGSAMRNVSICTSLRPQVQRVPDLVALDWGACLVGTARRAPVAVSSTTCQPDSSCFAPGIPSLRISTACWSAPGTRVTGS
jgi:hypothetical protein